MKFGVNKSTSRVVIARAVLCFFVTQDPASTTVNTVLFIALALCVGFSTGTLYGWLGKACRPQDTGTISGLVSAAGGLGGYFPPLIMGAVFTDYGDYFWGIMFFVGACVVSVLVSLWMENDRQKAALAA